VNCGIDRRSDSVPEFEVHPLDQPPSGKAWNLAELRGLLPEDQVWVEAAVLLGISEFGRESRIVFTRRNADLVHHGGQISFPGGRIDPEDGGPVEAALREAHEEVGLDPRFVEPLGFLDPYVTVTGFRVLPLVARIAEGYRLSPEPCEVDEVFQAPLHWLLDPENLVRQSAEFGGIRRKYWQVRYGQHRIWGATAAMLVNLRDRMR